MQISHFVLTPTSRHRVRHANDEQRRPAPSLLARILPSALHEPKMNSYTSAFELDVRPPQSEASPVVPERAVAVPPPRAPPLLTFLDETPVFSVRTTGTIELNAKLEARLGVERSFWIAVALAYLEFLEERDVSMDCRLRLSPSLTFDRRSLRPRRVIEPGVAWCYHYYCGPASHLRYLGAKQDRTCRLHHRSVLRAMSAQLVM